MVRAPIAAWGVMNTGHGDRDTATEVSVEPTRRTVLKGLGAAGLGAVVSSASAAMPAHASTPVDHGRWDGFAAAVHSEFVRMRLVGAAVAVVSADRVLLTLPLGVRDVCSGAAVTASTRFLVPRRQSRCRRRSRQPTLIRAGWAGINV
jgi:hypothetical protein